MELWNKIQGKLKKTIRTRSILLYLVFVFISAIFWGFLTFNSDIKIDIEVPVKLNKPKNVHLLANMPDTVTVTVNDRGYRFFYYLFKDSPTLTLRFDDYRDASGIFKIDQSHLRKAIGQILNKHATILSVLPENIAIKYTDLPGKLVPIKTDFIFEPQADYVIEGDLVLSQDSVLVFSDAKTLSKINEVYTYHVKQTDLTDTLHRKVTIAPINDAVIEPRSIDIMLPVEKLVKQKRTVKIDVRNAPAGVKVLLFPGDVEITFNCPRSRLKDNFNITPVVDYNSIDATPNNKLEIIKGEMPGYVKECELSIDSVEYIIEKH